MSAPVVLAIGMPERGHCYRLLGVVAALARRGAVVHVFTDTRFRPEVERAGGRLLDLFARFPLDEVDATSRPIPCRYVSFAGHRAAAIADEVASLRPDLVLYDTFSVIAPVVARRLGVPWVNVCAGHAAPPARSLRELEGDPRVALSPACLEAVRRLREEHGMANAGPFSYVDGLSPYLNLYAEPEQFLERSERAQLEPLAFFGALSEAVRAAPGAVGPFRATGGRPLVYVSFGTVVWRYFEQVARPAMRTILEVLGSEGAEVVASLGGADGAAGLRARLAGTGAQVRDDVDQWATLAQADLFVTHHGMNSTHEAIWHEVAMLSYPFFNDQPRLARRCADLGLALPLSGTPQEPLSGERVRAAFRRWREDREGFATRLAEARRWEQAVIGGREAVVDRVLSFARDR